MMKIADILHSKGHQVWSVGMGATVKEAVGMLAANRIGALIVYDEHKIAGIISERDIIRLCHEQCKDWCDVLVKDIMTQKVIFAKPEDTIDYAMGVMTQNRIRHIPVVNDKKKLEGIVSVVDIVKAKMNTYEFENRYLKEYLYGG